MSDTPVQVIVAAFNSPEKAGQVLAELKQGKKEGLIGIIDAAVVVKDAEGKLKITDSRRRGVRGFITGGVIGSVLGLLLAPPVGVVALGAGAIGTLVGKLRGAPLKAELKDIGSALPPNSSAIVAVVEHTWVAKLEAQLAVEGARVVQETIKADIAAQLNAGGNVLYTATGGGVARVAETPEGTRVSGVIDSTNGVFIGDAQFTDEQPVDDEAPSTASS